MISRALQVSIKAGTSLNLPDLPRLVSNVIERADFAAAFNSRFSEDDLKQFPVQIEKIRKLFMGSMCRKFIWSIIKQQEWDKQDMTIRDKFKFYHIEHIKSTQQSAAAMT